MAHFYSSSLPFAVPVKGGVSTGKLIYIQGTVPRRSDRFTINLQRTQYLSDSPRPDTSLHLSVRFPEQVVVRNSCRNGAWASEERHGGMPFHLRCDFGVILIVEANCYKIVVDGKQFTEFGHRMAKEVGSFLRVDGNVVIRSVTFQDSGMPGNEYQPSMLGSLPSIKPFYNPGVPFNANIGSIFSGRMVSVTGVPNSDCKRFVIQLQCGLLEDANVALVLSVRFDALGDHKTVVRNHRESGTWGTEIREGCFPFSVNSLFDVSIRAEDNSFAVAVNNQHFTEFPYRIRPLAVVDSLVVKGDVRLNMVRVQ